jgi:hypothetical protein
MKKTFSVRHSDAREIPGLSFSADGKFLVGFARPHPVQVNGAPSGLHSGSADTVGESSSEVGETSTMETSLLYWSVDKSAVLLFCA